MKFTISSSTLSYNLQGAGKVINNKSTLPILDCFLFSVEGNELRVTASDGETTLSKTLPIDNLESRDGVVAIPARRIQDSIKEFAEQPLTISIDEENWGITVVWSSGKLTIPGITGIAYPKAQSLNEEQLTSFSITSGLLNKGITSTIFATADDSLRPVMNGINIALSPSDITFVATDAHRLVRFVDSEVSAQGVSSFILPAKPAHLLRSLLPKDESAEVSVQYDHKNVIFTMDKATLVCRLIEGNFPNYNAVIPKNNDNNLSVDRLELLSALRRVSVCSSASSGLVHLDLNDNVLTITAQDLDYDTSAMDSIQCEYSGDPLKIGFKSPFLLDILSNLDCSDILVKFSDASRPGLFMPVESDENESTTSVLMLLMPLFLNA
ncbi:MAG: DNA polymerase III subunit beta [Rikenellaceae bacterium]